MFGLGKVKLIQFMDGKFGLKRGFIIPKYLCTDGSWTVYTDLIGRYCKFNTAKEVLELYEINDIRYKVISEDINDDWEVW